MQPQQLGPYRIIRTIGRGGMGAVYEAVHIDSGETAAIKALLGILEEEEEMRLRFESEIETLKRLRHPNIVRLFAFGEEAGMLYYVMELVNGPSLYQEIRRKRSFEWFEVAKIGLDICQGLRHAHDRGITHRDIKPANILLDQRGMVKISDFGIAQLFGGQRLTNVNSVVGTLEYMAPEQALAGPVGPKADLYSLGAVLYALLAGKPPFLAKTLSEILRKHANIPLEPIRSNRLDVPEPFEAIIADLLTVRQEDRPGNASLIARRIQSLLHATVGAPEEIEVPLLEMPEPREPARYTIPPLESESSRGMVVEGGLIDLGGIVHAEASEHFELPHANAPNELPSSDVSGPGTTVIQSFDSGESSADPPISSRLTSESTAEATSIDPRPPYLQQQVRHGEMLQDKPDLPRTKDEPIPEIYGVELPARQPVSEKSGTGEEEAPLDLATISNDAGRPDSSPMSPPQRVERRASLPTTATHEFTVNKEAESTGNSSSSGLEHFGGNAFSPSAATDETQAAPLHPVEPPSLKELLGAKSRPPVSDRPSTLHPAGVTTKNAASSSRFVQVDDDDLDDFEERPIKRPFPISLQTVLVLCALLLTGTITMYMLQPVPADTLYERIKQEVDHAGTDDLIVALRRAEPNIKRFLDNYPEHPSVDQVIAYEEELQLANKERAFERGINRTQSQSLQPAERAYIEAVALSRTDPEKAIEKLQAIIALYRSDRMDKLARDTAESGGAVAEMPEESATKARPRRGPTENCVLLARRRLATLERHIDDINREQVEYLSRRLDDADRLEATAPERAREIRRAIIRLYDGRDWAENLIQRSRKAQEQAGSPTKTGESPPPATPN